jgi:hypothetical protein
MALLNETEVGKAAVDFVCFVLKSKRPQRETCWVLSRHVAVFTAHMDESGPSFPAANAPVAKWANRSEDREHVFRCTRGGCYFAARGL